MTILHDDTEEDTQDRRSKHFRFERSVNLGTIITMLGGLITAFVAYQGIAGRFDHIERAAIKADIMWEHFIKEHEDISGEDLRAIR